MQQRKIGLWRTVPKCESQTGHVTVIPHSEDDKRRTGAMLQLPGKPVGASEKKRARALSRSPVKSNETGSLMVLVV